MTPTDPALRSEARISEEAAEWFVEFTTGEPDISMRTEFDKWLRMSPEHVRAYLDMLPLWNHAAEPGVTPDLTADELIARSIGSAEVIPLVPSQSEDRSVQEPPRFSRSRSLLIAASLLIALLGGSTFWWYTQGDSTIATAVGEQRSIALADGSTVELNSRSRIRVRFTDAEREIDLLEGQALFQVAKDANRPFTVISDTTRVRAVGTRFDVYRRPIGTTVTVIEGRVAVASDASASTSVQPSPQAGDRIPIAAPGSGAGARWAGSQTSNEQPIELAAGEQVTVTTSAVQRPVTADITAATAWRQRELVFNSTTLVEVAEEFNRYNTRRLTITDATLSDFHVTGVFSSTDPTSLLRFLRLQPGIRVQETSDEIRISSE